MAGAFSLRGVVLLNSMSSKMMAEGQITDVFTLLERLYTFSLEETAAIFSSWLSVGRMA